MLGLNAGTAYVEVKPSLRGWGTSVSTGLRGTERQFDSAGQVAGQKYTRSFGSRFMSGLGTAVKRGALVLGTVGVLGAAAFAKNAISLEQEFGKTMNQIQAATNTPAKGMRQLSDLAMKMGRDTTFSASDASKAMLELAHGGLKAATIQGGALQGTLTLAAAGELDMSDAANVAVKSMGQFNLHGKDMKGIAAALAGAANASSASVSDMGQALAQGGLAANSVGFSIQETTGILAAFSNKGLEGSDAGTSMKTALDRLVPSTKSAADAMRNVGLMTEDGRSKFVKANGEYKSAAQVAQVLKRATDELSSSERKRTISAIFGSDAQRAATILADEGAKGIRNMVKATSDQGAAQRMAQANMKGTAGAIEQMKGSMETASLAFGQAIRPLTIFGAGVVTEIANGAVPIFQDLGKHLRGLKDVDLSGIGKSMKGIDWGKAGAGLHSIGQSIKNVDWDSVRSGFGAGVADTVNVFAVAIGFLANHLDTLAKWMPAIIAGFIAFKTAQAAANAVSLAHLPIAAAQVGANVSLASANRALAAQMAITNGTERVGIVTKIRSRVVTLASAAAEKVAAGAKRVGAGAQWLLNAAMEANPIGLVIAAVVALVAIFVVAYKKSDTFRRIVNAAWDGIKKAALGVVHWFTGSFLPFFTKTIPNAFSALIGWVRKNWDVILAVITGPIGLAILVVHRNWDKITGFFSGAVDWVRGTWSKSYARVKGWITDPIDSAREGVSNILGRLRGAFSAAVTGIGKAWDGLKAAAAAPVNFVIETVYNKGIRGFVNGVLNKFGVDMKLPYALPLNWNRATAGASSGRNGPGVTRFAKGSWVPGTGRGDKVNSLLEPGEFVVRRNRAQYLEKKFPGALDRLNRGVPRGPAAGRFGDMELLKHGELPRFAAGGFTDERIRRAQRWATSKEQPGDQYQMGGYGPSVYDCSGLIGAVTHILRGEGPNSGRLGATSTMPWAGFKSGPGQFTVGWTTNYGGSGIGHTAGNLAGLNVESSGGEGPKVGANARGPYDPGFDHLMHLGPGGASFLGSGGGAGGGMVAAFVGRIADWLADKGKGLLSKIPGGGSVFGELARGIGSKAIDAISATITSRFGSTAGGGAGGFAGKATGAAQRYAKDQLRGHGWGPGQFGPLQALWNRESGWRWNAANPAGGSPSTSAYGIPQALPGSKMAAAGGDWVTNPATQINWGLNYIKGRYGTPSGAWAHSQANNWYDNGGILPKGVSLARNNTGRGEHMGVFTNAQWKLLKQAITRMTLGGGGRITTDWLTGVLDKVPKSAEQLRSEFLRTRDAMRGFRTRTEQARTKLEEISGQRRVQAAQTRMRQIGNRLEDLGTRRSISRQIRRLREGGTKVSDRDVNQAQRSLERAQAQQHDAANKKQRREAKQAVADAQKDLKQAELGHDREAAKAAKQHKKEIDRLKERRDEVRKLRRERRQLEDSAPIQRQERAQSRLNKALEAEKKARDRANAAAKAYRAAQDAALERARSITATGVGLGSIESAGIKTSGGIVSNLKRAIVTVKDWGGVVRSLIGAGLRGPILEEFIGAGPSAEAVRTGKSLLAGGQIAEINTLQDQLRRQAIRAGATASASYTPSQRAAIRRATPIKHDAAQAKASDGGTHVHLHGMPADTMEILADKVVAKVEYRQSRAGVT